MRRQNDNPVPILNTGGGGLPERDVTRDLTSADPISRFERARGIPTGATPARRGGQAGDLLLHTTSPPIDVTSRCNIDVACGSGAQSRFPVPWAFLSTRAEKRVPQVQLHQQNRQNFSARFLASAWQPGRLPARKSILHCNVTSHFHHTECTAGSLEVIVFLVHTPVEIEKGFSPSESTTSPKLSRYTFHMFGNTKKKAYRD
jgi:hypothetical protein